MFYTPTGFSHIVTKIFKENNAKYSLVFSTTYLFICFPELSLLGAINRITEHVYNLKRF